MARLERSVVQVAVIMQRWPTEVWDDSDYDDLHAIVREYHHLQGHATDEAGGSGTGAPNATEPLHDYDRALIAREKERLARIATKE